VIAPERFQKIRAMLHHRQPDLTVVMDNVNKAHNLSAIIRSCDCVGIGELHTAAGASKWTNVHLYTDVESAYQTLAEAGMQILVATNRDGCRDFRSVDYTLPTAIVVGAEWDGISNEAIEGADHAITIPMVGMGESLNVSVATAVMLFEAQRQRAAKGMYDAPQLAPETLQQMLFELSYPTLSRQLREEQLPYPPLDEQGNFAKVTEKCD
jgi:tRNA (guanosine-2'-O-)-methyltransferase